MAHMFCHGFWRMFVLLGLQLLKEKFPQLFNRMVNTQNHGGSKRRIPLLGCPRWQ